MIEERKDLAVITLSGPPCVGKTPLLAAIREFFPIKYGVVPVIKSTRHRSLIPDENPEQFMEPEEIRKLPKSEYLIGECRGKPQAIRIQDIMNCEEELCIIKAHRSLVARLNYPENPLRCKDTLTVFLSPWYPQDLKRMKKHEKETDLNREFNSYDKICELMRKKLDARARYQCKLIQRGDREIAIENNQEADEVYQELGWAFLIDNYQYYKYFKEYVSYNHLIVNSNGEGQRNWHRKPTGEFTRWPEGSAWKAVNKFAEIMGRVTGKPNIPRPWRQK